MTSSRPSQERRELLGEEAEETLPESDWSGASTPQKTVGKDAEEEEDIHNV